MLCAVRVDAYSHNLPIALCSNSLYAHICNLRIGYFLEIVHNVSKDVIELTDENFARLPVEL